MRALLRAACAATVTLAPVVARAQETFGEQRQLVISGTSNIELIGTSPSSGVSSTTLILAASADYFVVRHVSLGGAIAYEHESNPQGGGATLDSFAVGPRVGYAIDITSNLSLWPSLTIGFAYASVGSASATGWGVGGSLPLVLSPVEHFILGLGPTISVEALSASAGGQSQSLTATTYGAQLTLGGWVGL